MKYYKDVDEIKTIDAANFHRISGKEFQETYNSLTDYIVTKTKVYSSEEVKNLHEEERNLILSSGIALNEEFLFSLMNYQHLIDQNLNIAEDKKELLRILLKSEMHFIPFSFGDWNDGLYVIEKLNLVKLLLDGKWIDGYCTSYLDEDIYFIRIKFDTHRKKKDFLYEYEEKNDEDYDTFKNLEIYIPYSDFAAIYKSVISEDKHNFWKEHLNKDDYEDVN